MQKYPQTFTRNALISVFAILSLTACEILPGSGPFGAGFMNQGMGKNAVRVKAAQKPENEFRYALVDLSKPVLDIVSVESVAAQQGWPSVGSPNASGIRVGDTISVTIYESQSGGLFIPVEAGVRPGNFVNIPAQIVDGSGTINIPYAGEVEVAGRSPNTVAKEIEEKLGMRAIEPQAVVSVVERGGAEISVIGDVNNATKFNMNLNGEKILDAIAKAGGPKFPGYETFVSLQRGGKEWTIPFDHIVKNPKKNIYLQAKDTVYLLREAQSFQVYGAATVSGTYNFRKGNITLAEALGEGNGLRDSQANPEEIYVYRQEDKEKVTQMGIPLEASLLGFNANKVPVIYKLNLRDADGFFLAQGFPVQDKDVIYIANAASVEFTKFLDLLNPTSVTKINTHTAIEQ